MTRAGPCAAAVTRSARTARTARRPALLAVLAALVVLVVSAGTSWAPPAGAHGDDGTMGIEVTPGPAPLTARVRILLEYANDGDVAPGATVVADAVGPGGQTVGPAPLADQGQGGYEAVLTMPAAGAWTVTVTATGPAATATQEVTVVAAPATTAPTPATTDTPSSTDVRISSDRASQDEEPSDDGPGAALIAAIAVGVVAVAGAAVLLVRRR